LEVDSLCDGYTVPQNEVEHLDVRDGPSPYVPYFISECEQKVIYEHRKSHSYRKHLRTLEENGMNKNSPEIYRSALITGCSLIASGSKTAT